MKLNHLPFVVLTLSLLPAATRDCLAAPGSGPTEMAKASGVSGGLAVYLGPANADSLAGLRPGAGTLVQGLDVSTGRVRAAREALGSRGPYGLVSVSVFDGRQLPYVDRLVNLLVVTDSFDVSAEEISRVLARGIVMAREPLETVPTDLERTTSAGDAWTLYRKRIPPTIDEWGHFLHGADNNALSHDTAVGPPRHMQWLSGPQWTRHHDTDKGTYPTIRAVVSAAGRLYYLLDETPSSNMSVPSRWVLVARDGFSGVQLWKRPVEVTSFDRELEQVWRQILADGQHVYAQLFGGSALSQLDGATGDVVQTYAGTEGFREVIKQGDQLFFVGQQGQLIAIDGSGGRQTWSWQPGDKGEIVRLTLAAKDGRVFVKTATAACCLAAGDGSELWTTPLAQAEKPVLLRWPRERLIVAQDVVLVSFGGKDPTELNRDSPEFLGSHPRVRDYAGRLAALDAGTGKKLWEAGYMPNLESAPGEVYVNGDAVWLGPDYAEARDLHSGEPRQALDGILGKLWTDGHHYRCYPGKATSRYVLTAKRGIEFFDTAGDNHSRNNWVRSTCRVGVTPCNGLLYASPHSCGCYPEALINGFWALAAEDSRDWGPEDSLVDRLVPGPAFADGGLAQASADAEPWPTYRGDNARSGSTPSSVPARLQEAWNTDLGGRLSAVTVAAGKLFVTQVDQHRVHALDAVSGEQLWHFTANGRIDSPPTYYRGLLLFGSRDGCVYCLRARDGQQVWRFQAAPRRLQAVAREQLESLWPVVGSVLIEQGVAYAAAGRSSYLDDGLRLYALDPATGEVLHHRELTGEPVGTLDAPENAEQLQSKNSQNWQDYKTLLAADRSDSFTMEGGLVDVMSADTDSIFMRQMRFSRTLQPQSEPRQHLFSTSSLLDATEHHRTYWILGSGDFSGLPVAFPWIAGSRLQVPFGLQMAFDEHTVWSIRGGAGRKRQDPDYRVVTSARPDPSNPESGYPDFAERRSGSDANQTNSRKDRPAGSAPAGSPGSLSWTTDLDARPRAIVRAGTHLFVGGTRDTGYDTALDEWQAGRVIVFDSANGAVLHALDLDAPPVWDGLAAADNRLYAALEDGHVVCLKE